MNKTSFLSLVRQASNISDQDVEELEKLVVNFPYCQTAHLLIAKAAYDNGSMLSNQKLKKAAIYAANRQLLKKLIYTSDASVALNPVQAELETVSETPEKVSEVALTVLPEVAPQPEIQTQESENQVSAAIAPAEVNPIATSENEQLAEPETEQLPELISENDLAEEVVIASEIAGITENETAATISGNTTQETEISEPETESEISTEDLTEVTEAEISQEDLTAVALSELYEEEVIAQEILETETENISPAAIVSENSTQVEAEITTTEPLPATPETESIVAENTPELPAAEAELPAEEAAEPITEVLEPASKFIAEPAQTLTNVPELHELHLSSEAEAVTEQAAAETTAQTELHETLASFDKYLFRPEKESEEPEAESDLKVVYAQDEIQEIYNNDPLGYWMGSSRMGESLQLKNELTSSAPVEFHPELILEYSKTHVLHKEIKPVNSNLSRQLEIIDEFLKMTPRLKAMANAKMKPEAQEDLSIKSSKISKNLATESLANIMVQQGKIKKAIKIYEHLILKIPEKKPYFVAQILKLQNLE